MFGGGGDGNRKRSLGNLAPADPSVAVDAAAAVNIECIVSPSASVRLIPLGGALRCGAARETFSADERTREISISPAER